MANIETLLKELELELQFLKEQKRKWCKLHSVSEYDAPKYFDMNIYVVTAQIKKLKV